MDVIYAPKAAEGKGLEVKKPRFVREIQSRFLIIPRRDDRTAVASRTTWDMLARADVKRIEKFDRFGRVPAKVVKGQVLGESKL